jgi:hypothetical protein
MDHVAGFADECRAFLSVMACATPQERAVSAEVGAWLAGRPGGHLPAVASVNVYDGGALRLAPLRTLYERGILRHAPGVEALATALRSHHAESERNPMVTRLVACYPWVGARAEGEEPRGMAQPRVRGSMLERREDATEDPRPMWARVL